MADEQNPPPAEGVRYPQASSGFTVTGQVSQAEEASRDLDLKAYVFDPAGRFLGDGDVDERGSFKAGIRLAQPSPVEVIVGPPGDPHEIRRSSLPRQRFSEKDWTNGRLKADVRLTPDISALFLPLKICVSGHVRKVFTQNGDTSICPVPFVKVEIFDVDREGCWWPYLIKYLDRISNPRVLRASDLIKAAGGAARTAMEGPRLDMANVAPAALDARVGEVKSLSAEVASRVENLTLTSIVAPWIYFPYCFYSKAIVCETYTDCDGYFNCCFPWWIFHFRNGRLRFDLRPDIIIRVTQIINGVSTVIYMDPYTSTRWNSASTHIDLFLDNEAIVCGGCATDPLPGSSKASLLQIGSDPVWQVDQMDGKFKTPPYSNGAYGGALYLRGNFTADLLTGSPKRYYKLSWAPLGTTDFTPIATPLSALRSAPGGVFETYLLGPQPSGPLAGLYEAQDTAHWWLMPGVPGGSGMVLGLWDTSFETDQGGYTVRMEVYDEAGNKIVTMQFPDHGGNGTGVDPAPPPIRVDHLDLNFHVDNKPVTFGLTTPATNDCGVIPWSPALTIPLHVHAEQDNHRVHSWNLYYVKGVNPTRIYLADAVYNAGISPVDVNVNADALLVGLETTCAFALILSAWSHVRNNWGFAWVDEQIRAIAIERCGP
ncbi:MAG: hypothetical protein QOH06_943 [Acidobacteriota bacterium]|jgi:hypothetical protein|nr:hypothetical protein [Acidobacteriota bacterium]